MDKIIIVSGPVIVENNKVLLDKSGEDSFWKFCGGQSVEGENLRETAVRRAKEELGIDVKIKNSEAFVMTIPKPKDEDKDVFLVHYLAKRIGDIKPGEDIREWKWLPLNDLSKDLAPNIIPALKYFKFL